MKKKEIKELIGLHCSTEYHMGISGICKDIVKSKEVDSEGNPIYNVIIEDKDYDDIEKVDISEVIFDYPIAHLWEFEYYNSVDYINGDEQFNKCSLWLDAMLPEDAITSMITILCNNGNYFSLRNLKIIDTLTKDLKIK